MVVARCMLIPAILLVACARGGEAPGAAESLTVANVGFRTPESVLHDPHADVYLVANINGSPLATDDNGFISRLRPDGTVEALRWIDGRSPEVTLNAPKGMVIIGDTLFVADIDAVRLFTRETGAPLGARPVPGATFLNDLAAAPGGTLYVTDSGLRAGEGGGFAPSGTDAVYRFESDGTAVPLVRGDALGRPNGIVVDGHRIMLVTFGTGRVMLVVAESGQVSGLPAPPAGQLDGVVKIGDGIYLISSWEGRAVYRLGPGGQYTVAVSDVEAPADIGYDARRHRVLIPLFTTDRVEIRTVR